ncbi:MAG: 7-cyano-7-deazaguanine synthase [Candidatus Bathyarchaeia archaeon]|jgi:7-cyano-7-deazaguanine synthase
MIYGAEKAAYPILSGGIDSTLGTIIAKEKFKVVKPIFFDYGHKAKNMEWEAVCKICSALKIEKPEKIPICMYWDESYLTKGKDVEKFIMHGRNLIFTALASSFVRTDGGGTIITGFNESDAGFDTSKKFVGIVNQLLEYENEDGSSQGREVKLLTPLMNFDKIEIINEYKKRGMENILKLTYSCYKGSKKPCGKCHACKNRASVLDVIK